jgi:anti-sigma B factor antagonist
MRVGGNIAFVALEIDAGEVDSVPVFVLDGELDIYTVPRFQRIVEQVPSSVQQIILDLRLVSLVDSSGLGALLRLARHGTDWRQVALVCEGRAVPRLLELTKLADRFLVVASVSEATRAFASHADDPASGT